MIVTIDEAIQNVDGYFYLFHYNCVVSRIKGTEHFGCFKDNDLKSVTIPCVIFCRSSNDFYEFIDECNRKSTGSLSMYHYNGESGWSPNAKIYYAYEAVRYIYELHNFKYLAHLTTIGSREYIH
jgi:hypothetical protein